MNKQQFFKQLKALPFLFNTLRKCDHINPRSMFLSQLAGVVPYGGSIKTNWTLSSGISFINSTQSP